jgi:hypothetical protein
MPRRLEPLKTDERDAAVQAAATNPVVKPVLEGRHSVAFVAPNIKDRRAPEASDQVVVGVYDYEGDRSLVAVVDLGTQDVVATEELALQFQLSPDERREAEELAGQDSRVESFLGDRDMNPLTRLFFPRAGAAGQRAHRHAIVFLRPDDTERRYAVVDLSARAVVDVFGPEAFLEQ